MPKLHPHIGVPVFRHRVLLTLAAFALVLVVAEINVSPIRFKAPQPVVQAVEKPHQTTAALSDHDADSYRQAFRLQDLKQFEQADAVVSKVSNSMLRGVLLGERYLSGAHDPSFSELALWLARYGDHAQAQELYIAAREHAPADADFLTEPLLAPHLKAFKAGFDRSQLLGEKDWVSGLAAFRRHDMHTAAAHFKSLAESGNDYLSPEDKAACAFWTWRSLKDDEAASARRYLDMAADERPGFYSLLARRILGESTAPALETEATEALSFRQKGAVRRAIALKQIGQDALAEKELRTLFPGSIGAERARVMALARELNLPAAQMRMTVAAAYDASAGETFYPLPRWKPTLGFKLEPALLFAIIRQESGFNPNARSASGATGVMQLMPATAHAMAADARLKVSDEPAVNMTLGQRYIERLMEVDAVGDNLVYVLAAYNAGPGALTAWRKNVRAEGDPLLFIESLPSLQARDYVQHVMGNYWIYSEMLAGHENGSLKALAQNRWPHYERSLKQTAMMASRLNPGMTE